MKLEITSRGRALLILGAALLGGIAFALDGTGIALRGVTGGLESTEPDRTLALPYARAGA